MLRVLLLLVLLANAVVYGWLQGWFAPGWPPPRAHEREPERLAAQVRPELVAVLPSPAASAALDAAREAAAQCLQAGPFGDVELAAAEATLLAAQLPAGSWARTPVQPLPWLLSAGRPADADARRAREEELRRLNLPFELLEAPAAGAALAGTLVLSRHPSREAAEAALAALAAAGLRGARVVEQENPPPQFWLRAERADAALQERLRALPPQALAGGFVSCD
jgi:hypothetical protein